MSHIAHRLNILTLSVSKLLFKSSQLSFQNINISIYLMNILLNTIYYFLTLIYLGIYSNKMIQTLLYISLVLTQSPFLLLNFLFNLRTLILQALYRSICKLSSFTIRSLLLIIRLCSATRLLFRFLLSNMDCSL